MPGVGPQGIIHVSNVFLLKQMVSTYQVISQPVFEKKLRDF
jgi:hypothetical protein